MFRAIAKTKKNCSLPGSNWRPLDCPSIAGGEYETNALPTEPKEHDNGVTCANFKTIFLILCLTCTVFLYYKIQK